MKTNKSLHERLGICIGRLLAQTKVTTQPTGSLRFGRVTVAKQLRRSHLSTTARISRRILLRHGMGVKLSVADQNFMKLYSLRVVRRAD